MIDIANPSRAASGAPARAKQSTSSVTVEVSLCVPEDQRRYLPRGIELPSGMTAAEAPRLGEVIQLSPSSVWAVAMVIHDWPTPTTHRIEVWLERVKSDLHERPQGFAYTQ